MSSPPASQAAGTLLKDLPNGAPKQGIIIDDLSKFYTIKPTFSTTNNAFVFYNGSPTWSWLPAADAKLGYSVKYNGTTAASGTVAGNFSLRWNSIAKDANGNVIDIVLKVSNFRATGGTQPVLINIRPNGEIWSCAATTSASNCSNWFDCEFFFYKRGTNTGTTSTATMQFRDLDVWNPNTWDESVRLLNNYDSKIHIIPDDMKIPGAKLDKAGCWLVIEGLTSNPTFRARENHNDNDTLHTGFCVSAKNGFKFSWWGRGCSTIINDFYGQNKIIATKGAGGTITSEGTTIVPWKHDKTYTATASTNYKIKSITVKAVSADGTKKNIPVSVPANTKTFNYKFTEVVQDHTIDVQFEKIKTSISYDKNLSVATGTTAGATLDAGTATLVSKNGFTAAGYTFTGWNTKADGTGTKYMEGASITVGETPVVLYAQWQPIYYNIIASSEGSGSLLIGGLNAGRDNKVAWHGSLEFEIKAFAGNKISSIAIDGRQIEMPPITEEDGRFTTRYNFSNVEANHSIHVVFEPIQVSVKWIDASNGEEVATYGLNWGETSPVPEIPTHQGRRFTYFSGDDWHHATEDRVVYINYTGYTYNIPNSGSSKYNGFTFDCQGEM